MKVLVVLLAIAAFCYADDDDSVEVTYKSSLQLGDDDDSAEIVSFTHVQAAPVVPQVKSITHPVLKVPIPHQFAQYKTVPSTVLASNPQAAPVAYSASASPAVMKIPKPNIKFNMPETQAVPVQFQKPVVPTPAALPVPATAVMPKTTLRAEAEMPAIPAPWPVATMKTAEFPASVPAATVKAVDIPGIQSPVVPSTIFQHNIQSLSTPYYTTALTYGVPHAVPAVAHPSFAVQHQTAPALQQVPAVTTLQVAEPNPIQYTTAIHATSTPWYANRFDTQVVDSANPLFYWNDLAASQYMTNFVSLKNGGFSYVNVIGN